MNHQYENLTREELVAELQKRDEAQAKTYNYVLQFTNGEISPIQLSKLVTQELKPALSQTKENGLDVGQRANASTA